MSEWSRYLPLTDEKTEKCWLTRLKQWLTGVAGVFRLLDDLLPRLQGRAGDFEFNQLSQEKISNYSELVKELKSRFRTVEAQKTLAAKLSQRVQKYDETVEEYTAELKRLYWKVYTSRDNKTRQEDLVRRFLDGLKDGEAGLEIEFHKEPEDIDEQTEIVTIYIWEKKW